MDISVINSHSIAVILQYCTPSLDILEMKFLINGQLVVWLLINWLETCSLYLYFYGQINKENCERGRTEIAATTIKKKRGHIFHTRVFTFVFYMLNGPKY